MKHSFFLCCAFMVLLLIVPMHARAADDIDSETDMLKPKIEYVIVDSITHDPSGYFNILHYTARWRGDNELGVGVGEYYEGMITLVVMMRYRDYSEYAFEEDGVTYYEISGDTGIISPDCYAYIDFCVQNRWGSDEYEIELLPGGIVSSKDMLEDDIEDIRLGEERFEVFDCTGHRLGVFSSRDDIAADAPKGLLIIRRLRGNSVVSTEKFFNKQGVGR